ncbi:MAG: cytochrome c biogenesis CcdA family protein [Thermodesulfovibrio sp.]|jgi:cytochrome c-type biogenesis protein|uniref:Cytochrome C biogenesis protein n=2 Tax=Thermodesulfovibrio TaxID=28261 RepID=A0A2J6WHN6_9BACT|nr:MAG: cytochrome C biogenesis protein [Thermodesulfovibrio aggregans]
MNEITLIAAFAGGFLSFFSPCILPLLPVYISLFSGLSITEISQGSSKLRILFHTLLFIAGFSTVYLALGAGSSLIGSLFFDYQYYLKIIGGVFLILFGFLLLGLIRSGIFLREFRLNLKIQKFGSPLGAFLIGLGFAAGWSPCIGPLLGSILIYSGMSGSVITGLKMLGAYSLGIAIPFLVLSLLINALMQYLKRFMKFFKWMNYAIGFILIFLGLFMIFQ